MCISKFCVIVSIIKRLYSVKHSQVTVETTKNRIIEVLLYCQNSCEIILIYRLIFRLLLSSLGASLVTSYKTGYKLCKSQVCKEAGKLITENIKQSVNPCDDFYEHACGGWVEKNLANEELASYTQINKLDDIVISQLKGLFQDSRKVN